MIYFTIFSSNLDLVPIHFIEMYNWCNYFWSIPLISLFLLYFIPNFLCDHYIYHLLKLILLSLLQIISYMNHHNSNLVHLMHILYFSFLLIILHHLVIYLYYFSNYYIIFTFDSFFFVISYSLKQKSGNIIKVSCPFFSQNSNAHFNPYVQNFAYYDYSYPYLIATFIPSIIINFFINSFCTLSSHSGSFTVVIYIPWSYYIIYSHT